MPLYEYRCEGCGPFDAFRSLAERDEPMFCQDCQGRAVRMFSPPTILSTGLGGIRRSGSGEPRLVKQSGDREPSHPRNPVTPGGRPWMFNH